MISLDKFRKRTADAGMSETEIATLYDLLRKFCILCVAEQRRSGERLQLYHSMLKILKATENRSSFLCDILADFLRIEIAQQLLEPNKIPVILNKESLDKVGDAIKKHLEWTAKDKKTALKTLELALLENKKAMGNRSWKLPILTGLAVVLTVATGVGYAVHKHNQDKKEKEEKK